MIQRTGPTAVAVCVALVVLLSGCTTLTETVDDPKVAPHSATATPTDTQAVNVPGLKWPDGSNFTAIGRALEDASPARRDVDFKQLYDTSHLASDGKAFAAFALGPDGSLFGALGKLADISRETRTLASHESVGTYVDRGFTELTRTPGKHQLSANSHITGGAVSENDVVWAEIEDGTSLTGGWTIYNAPRDTGKASVLATSSDAGASDDTPMALGAPIPVISASRAFWQTPIEDPKSGAAAGHVVSADLAEHGSLRVEHHAANAPANFGGTVAFLDTSVNEDGTSLARGISVLVPGGEPVELLHVAPAAPAGLEIEAFDSEGTVFGFSYGGDHYVVDSASGSVASFPIPNNAAVAGSAICGSRSTWTLSYDGVPTGERYIYNTQDSTLKVVSNKRFTGAAVCTGDYISWALWQPSGGAFQIWDVVTRWGD